MNILDKDQFAKAFTELDATSEPEQIPNLIDRDEQIDLQSALTGQWFYIDKGELKQWEADDGEQEAA